MWEITVIKGLETVDQRKQQKSLIWMFKIRWLPLPYKKTGAIFSRTQFSSVQFSRSVVSDSLRPHESQHARPPCPSPSPGVHSDARSSSPWCHPTISSSVVPFSSCHQSFPASGSFQMNQLFTSDGQSIGVGFILHLGKLRHTEVKEFIQGHWFTSSVA